MSSEELGSVSNTSPLSEPNSPHSVPPLNLGSPALGSAEESNPESIPRNLSNVAVVGSSPVISVFQNSTESTVSSIPLLPPSSVSGDEVDQQSSQPAVSSDVVPNHSAGKSKLLAEIMSGPDWMMSSTGLVPDERKTVSERELEDLEFKHQHLDRKAYDITPDLMSTILSKSADPMRET
eukprot:769454_1